MCSLVPSNLRLDKDQKSRISWNKGLLVAAFQVAHKDVAKGGDGRPRAFRRAAVTDAKKAKENGVKRARWFTMHS